MTVESNIRIEKAIRFLAERMPVSENVSRKPKLFHDIRVGTYLYENGYAEDIVVAGFLHDVIEFAGVSAQEVAEGFGGNVARLVSANTKDDSIADGDERIAELARRCVADGQDALIIKAADTIDSFKWYSDQRNEKELEYCRKNAEAILRFKPDGLDDRIFDELERYV